MTSLFVNQPEGQSWGGKDVVIQVSVRAVQRGTTLRTEEEQRPHQHPISRVPSHNKKQPPLTFPHFPTGKFSRKLSAHSLSERPLCCNTAGTPASIVLKTSYNTPSSPPADYLLLSEQSMSATKIWSLTVRMMHWFGNNADNFISVLIFFQTGEDTWENAEH